VRPAERYGTSHVPGSLHVGLSGQFASWAGTLLPADTEVVLIAESDRDAEQARMRLTRVGIESVAGVLSGGVEAWAESGRPVASVEQIGAGELSRRLEAGEPIGVLDVRRPGEVETGRISGSRTIPLHELASAGTRLDVFDRTAPLAAICAGGYRSAIATSVLERAGFLRVANVVGGMAAWTGAGLETSVPANAPTPAAAG
jgi:hydroxyacylglutathione hydrolase